MKTASIGLLALICFVGTAFADTPLKPLVGAHPVISYLANDLASGTAEIVDDGTQVGLKLTAAAMSSASVPNLSLLSPVGNTAFLVQDKVVTQEYSNGSDSLNIRYTVELGYVAAKVTQKTNGAESSFDLVLSSGGAPGEQWNGPNLVELAQGVYDVVTIAGEPPHSEASKIAKIKKKGDESIFEMPFCGETFCDLGENYFPDAETTVLKTSSSTEGDLYRIFVREEGQLKYFTFLIGSEQSVFINHQYVLPPDFEATVTLEHVIKRK